MYTVYKLQSLTHADWPSASMTLIALMTESLLIAEHQQVISQAQLWLQTYLTALRHARAT